MPMVNTANSVFIPLKIKVCGYELIEVSDSSKIPEYIYDSNVGLKTLDGTHLLTLFKASNDSDCPIIGFELTDNTDSLYISGGV